MAECLILGNNNFNSSSGIDKIKLLTTDYNVGDTIIKNLNVSCMPFLAKAWSGTLSNQVTQGTNGIALTEQGYIAMPFTGFNLPSWELSLSILPTTLPGSSFTTFITLYDTEKSAEFGVSYYKTSDRIFYAIANTSIAESMSADVVPGAFSEFEDNGFKSTNITSGEFLINFICDETYITVYLNNSPRLRVLRTKISYNDNVEIRIGCVLKRSDIRSFTGEVTNFEVTA